MGYSIAYKAVVPVTTVPWASLTESSPEKHQVQLTVALTNTIKYHRHWAVSESWSSCIGLQIDWLGTLLGRPPEIINMLPNELWSTLCDNLYYKKVKHKKWKVLGNECIVSLKGRPRGTWAEHKEGDKEEEVHIWEEWIYVAADIL